MFLSLIPSNYESIKGLTALIRSESLDSYRVMPLEVQHRQTQKYSFLSLLGVSQFNQAYDKINFQKLPESQVPNS